MILVENEHQKDTAIEARKLPIKYGTTVARIPATTILIIDTNLFFLVKVVFNTFLKSP